MSIKTEFPPGKRVTSTSTKFPGHGTVIKPLQKNVQVLMDSGQTVRFSPMLLADYSPDGVPDVRVTTFSPPPVAGTVVQVAEVMCMRNSDLRGLWVVIGDSGDKTRITRIGGWGNRYWRIPNQHLEPVEVTVTLKPTPPAQ